MLKASYQISVVNDTTQATPTNFQQLIQTTLQYPSGVRFWRPIDGWLYGWLESLSSTNQANIWVKIPSSIPANGVYQIYMVEDSSLNFDGNYWGEAPNLSSTYGQYDNGASIFSNYWNFAGTSLPSGWTSSIGSSSGSVTVNNGVTLASGTGGSNGWGTIYYEFTMPSSNQIAIEVFGQTAETGRQRMYLTNTGAGSIFGGYGSDLGFDYGIFGEITSGDLQYFWNGYYSPNNPAFAINTNYIVQYILTGSTFYWNILSSSESQIASQSTTQPSTTNVLSLIDDDDAGATQSTYYWIRFRAYPPNGVMPETAIVPVQAWEVFMPPLP